VLLQIHDHHEIKTILHFFLELVALLQWRHRRSPNSPVRTGRRWVFYTSHFAFGKKEGPELISLERIQKTLILGPPLAITWATAWGLLLPTIQTLTVMPGQMEGDFVTKHVTCKNYVTAKLVAKFFLGFYMLHVWFL